MKNITLHLLSTKEKDETKDGVKGVLFRLNVMRQSFSKEELEDLLSEIERAVESKVSCECHFDYDDRYC